LALRSTRWKRGGGAIFASKQFRKEYKEQLTYLLAGMTKHLSNQMESERLSTRGEICFCRFHICRHYEEYKERCEKGNIPINHWAIPWPLWKAMEEAKEEEKRGRMMKKQKQQQLDFKTMAGPCEFTRAGILNTVTKVIATNNQVSC
jgi:hypothetical protein